MKARFKSSCSGCGCWIRVGQNIKRGSGGSYVHTVCPDVFGSGVGARNGYEHWNEDADYMWWMEEGRHAA